MHNSKLSASITQALKRNTHKQEEAQAKQKSSFAFPHLIFLCYIVAFLTQYMCSCKESCACLHILHLKTRKTFLCGCPLHNVQTYITLGTCKHMHYYFATLDSPILLFSLNTCAAAKNDVLTMILHVNKWKWLKILDISFDP